MSTAASPPPSEWTFELVGGNLCLDLCNTVPTFLAPPGERRDRLPDYATLLSWARQSGILDAATATRLRRVAGHRPAEAARVLDRAHRLRAASYATFSAIAHGKRAPDDALAALSEEYASTHERQRLVARGKRYELECACEDDALDQVLWPVARAAIELLTSPRVERVRLCEAASQESCTWLFVDESKNHSRRWCSMRDCGNRAKVRRHYERHKHES